MKIKKEAEPCLKLMKRVAGQWKNPSALGLRNDFPIGRCLFFSCTRQEKDLGIKNPS
jgi:hypothetical protein